MTIEMNNDPNWVRKMAEKEAGCIVSVGGLFTRISSPGKVDLMKPIFSGDASVDLWRQINKVSKKRRRKKIAKATQRALYAIGCHCADLESQVNKLREEINKLLKAERAATTTVANPGA